MAPDARTLQEVFARGLDLFAARSGESDHQVDGLMILQTVGELVEAGPTKCWWPTPTGPGNSIGSGMSNDYAYRRFFRETANPRDRLGIDGYGAPA